MLAAVSSTLLAWVAMREAISPLVAAMRVVPSAISDDAWRTCVTMRASPSPMPSMACMSRPISSTRPCGAGAPGVSAAVTLCLTRAPPCARRTLKSPAARRAAALAASSSGRLTSLRAATRKITANAITSAKPKAAKRSRVAVTSAITSSRIATPPTSHCHSGTVMNETLFSRGLVSPSVASADVYVMRPSFASSICE
jgi:hypothetical protein